MTDTLNLSLLQFAPSLGDPERNAALILDAAARVHAAEPARPAAASLAVTPELALTGYDLRDAAPDVAAESPRVAERLAAAGPLVVGYAERARDGAVYNSAAHVADGRVVANHRKVYLPTYGMFDEARVFASGGEVVAYDWNGWRIGLLVCEDFWHPGLAYALCAQGIDLLVVIAAGPGRGVWEAEAGARFASWRTWRQIAAVYARVFGIYVALANRVGVEEGVSFAGGSCVAAPDGGLLADGREGEEAVVSATLTRAELARLRTPAWHGRDDRPLVVARALLRAADVA